MGVFWLLVFRCIFHHDKIIITKRECPDTIFKNLRLLDKFFSFFFGIWTSISLGIFFFFFYGNILMNIQRHRTLEIKWICEIKFSLYILEFSMKGGSSLKVEKFRKNAARHTFCGRLQRASACARLGVVSIRSTPPTLYSAAGWYFIFFIRTVLTWNCK